MPEAAEAAARAALTWHRRRRRERGAVCIASWERIVSASSGATREAGPRSSGTKASGVPQFLAYNPRMRLLAVLLSLLSALPSFAQLTRVDTKAIDRAVASMMRDWQIPGAAVAVVRNDRVVYLAGYGTKEMGGGEPVSPDTLFQIASTSKAFTTTALAMLASEGRLSFDDPVRKYVEYFHLSDPCADSQVTIRDIVSHRTGLARHDELWDNSPYTREEVVRRVGSLELAKPFRTAYQYHNIMFITAGEVVSHAAGIPWDDFVRTRIFKPLAMNGTVVGDLEWEAADHATGYRWDWKTGKLRQQKPIDTKTLGSGGAIKSSARDMANWIRFQLGDGRFEGTQLVDPDLLGETKMPQTPIRVEGLTRDNNPDTHIMSYGMGWTLQDYRGEYLVSHAGALNGFRTQVGLLPKRGSGFVVMVNAGRGYAVLALRNTLADILIGKSGRDWNAYFLMVEQKANDKEERDRQERDARRVPGTSPTLPLEAYAGSYESPVHGTATIAVENGGLVFRWSRMVIPLTHFHYDVFNARSDEDWVDEQVTFTLGPAHAVESMTIFGERFAKK
jgi:CubicO group peptidase (beta-lactamase class C family)